jgi:large subunit ribosomal protein L10e
MTLRKANAYSKRHATPYTRNSRRKNRAYIKVIPHVKVAKYNLGDQQAFKEGKHKFVVKMVSNEDILIRDNAIEAGRMYIHKQIEEQMPGQYFFAVKVQPHHLLRNNKTSGIAGADRLSTGMGHSFGVIEGRAAIVKKGKTIFIVSCADDKCARIARDVFESVKAKVPCSAKIVFEQIK